jgi:hypothetical protein
MAAALAESINNLTYHLPVELVEYTLLFLQPSDLYSFMYSCKRHKNLVLSLYKTFARNYSQNIPDPLSQYVWYLFLNFEHNYPIEYVQKMKQNEFKRILSAFNYASTNRYELFYNNCIERHILFPENRLIGITGITGVTSDVQTIPISEIKLRYALMNTFFNINIHYVEQNAMRNNILLGQVFKLIKSLTSIQFSFFMLIFKKYPSILNSITLGYGVLYLIDFLKDTTKPRFDIIIRFFNIVISHGGKLEHAVILDTCGPSSCNRYINTLCFGLTEADAYDFARNRVISRTIEQLITFKALIPIIGYKFAKYFIIDIQYDINNSPHFLSVVSKYYSMGYICVHRCKKLLENPSEENLSKLKAKRRRLE